MEEIIKSVSEAEARGEEIRDEAFIKAAEIIAAASERANDINKLCESECKAYREKSLAEAKSSAQKKYDYEIIKARADSARYAETRLKDCDGEVEEIVRRVLSRGR